MTDPPPHELIPLKPGTYRQYFRLVAHPISCWWIQYSTARPQGLQHDYRVLDHNNFEESAYMDYDHRDRNPSHIQSDRVDPSS